MNRTKRGTHSTIIDAAEDVVRFLKKNKIPHSVGLITTLNGKRSGGIITLKTTTLNPEVVRLEVVGNFYKQVINVYYTADEFLSKLQNSIDKFRSVYRLNGNIE